MKNAHFGSRFVTAVVIALALASAASASDPPAQADELKNLKEEVARLRGVVAKQAAELQCLKTDKVKLEEKIAAQVREIEGLRLQRSTGKTPQPADNPDMASSDERAALGVMVSGVDAAFKELFAKSHCPVPPDGLTVDTVATASPAETAKIRNGDVLEIRDGTQVINSRQQFTDWISKQRVGEVLTLVVWRMVPYELNPEYHPRWTRSEVTVTPVTWRDMEAARKAAEEFEVDGLVLLKKTVEARSGDLTGTITGIVVNRRDYKLKHVRIVFNLYDKSGAQVGTSEATINGLEPGGRWNFKAVSLGPEFAHGTEFAQYKPSELWGD